MEAEAHKLPIIRHSNKKLIITTICVAAIVIIGVVIYYFATLENANQSESENEITNELNSSITNNSTSEITIHSTPPSINWLNNEEIQLLRKYLQFPTISLETDLGECVEFLKSIADSLNLTVSVFYPANDQNPVVLMTWLGLEPELPSILLNSHMDVVPVALEYWKYPPFSAHIDENGNIYARGAQDMKSVGMQYLAAIRALKHKGVDRLKRTIHLTYVPDEEPGGQFGLGAFVKTNEFARLNVGCALDEGYPSATNDLEVFYTEKTEWEVNIIAQGHSGHASVMFNDTAGEKLNYVISKFLEMRREEAKKLNELHYSYGNVTVVNLTFLKGGLQTNVVPPEVSAFIDMRLSVNTDWDELDQTIHRWAKEAGENVTVKILKSNRPKPSPIDASNPYWMAFQNATEQLHLSVAPGVFRAATDSRYIRELNIPAFGFSPLMNTSPMLHEHNEYINAETYLKGITIYEKIVEMMGNIADN